MGKLVCRLSRPGAGEGRLVVRSRGFTLIELLVVLAIVALLLTIVAPRYMGSIDNAKEVALKENLKVMRINIDRFLADKGRYPESLDELVGERYLRAIPSDPITESSQTWIVVPADDVETGGVADVRSGAEGASRRGEVFAEW
ncbi:prepilin-type N-terminal cleavage/methylation domain-containing protein [Hydrogenophaga palleronii]|uniref:type II secretion system protein n=1 Tax=Hydrogenophaga palleronii TaxID=65655 RepID=UPI00286AE52D|nr:prepilin-type N-terminal cleavage/methylation domain-containing protein [Hydrogenophaga palleronii]